MKENGKSDPAKSQSGSLKILGYISVFPLILIMTGGSILGYGWLRHMQTPQTIGAIVAGIGCVALLSRFLRGRA